MAKVAATSTTKLDNVAGATDVPVASKRKVTYVLHITSTSSFSMPYALAINGKALAAFAKKPARVSGQKGKIVQLVDAGSKVALFLNSDAHPSYRKAPVYEVTVGAKDIVVTITEKKGKHSDSDTPTLTKAGTDGKPDEYAAPLTGDIWMKVSHAYTRAEAEALIPAGTDPVVKAAVLSMYPAPTAAVLNLQFPDEGKDKPALGLQVTLNDSDNPKQNITDYKLLRDGVPRAHPAGYAALFTAAREAGVTKVRVTSCWRPLLGSIAHRAGLGLDVDAVGSVHINRQELRIKSGPHDGNVSDAEKKAFAEVEKADAELKAARVAKDDRRTVAAQSKREEAKDLWEQVLALGEPVAIKAFRSSLLRCACVGQLFDPWYMDDNTRDPVEPQANEQRPTSGGGQSNETLHAHHLHITVLDTNIL